MPPPCLSTLHLALEIDRKVDGRKDNRRVEKIHYMDQKRKSAFTAQFVFKNGNKVRVITVSFEGSLE